MTRPRRRATIIAASVAAVVAATTAWAFNADGAEKEIPSSVIHADTSMGVVELAVDDLERMRSFYTTAVGLKVLDEVEGTVTLGTEGQEILRLTSQDVPYAGPRDAGLYHAAILYPDGPALARVLVDMFNVAGHLYGGSADHFVSEAFYFSDPEGNGLELYIDTPSQEWEWEDGQVRMGSAPLDPSAFVAEHLDSTTTGEATVGHVHLKVGDLAATREFYVDALGFAVTAEADGALFMSAGGYHHHLAANTWSSSAAGERSDTLGLESFTVTVPTHGDVEAAATRLDAAGYDFVAAADGLRVDDPWGNAVHLTAEH